MDVTQQDADTFDAVATGDRGDLFRYVSSQRRDEYRAIMGLFVGPLLGDHSPAEVVTQLRDLDIHLAEDEVYARCETLERWGNLIRGVRDTRVATIRDFHKGRNRFHASKFGGKAHRLVEGIMSSGDGAREVARELLGATVATLDRILGHLADGTVHDVDALTGDVTTVFNNQSLFNESVSDFYAYLNQVLTRYDLAGEEYAEFKDLLLDYVDLISADVIRHAPAINARLAQTQTHLDTILAAMNTLPTLVTHDGAVSERILGRAREDWDLLAHWYSEDAGRSGPATLRMAADQALGQLLTNAKRMLASAGAGLSRRSDLLKLAGWFDSSDDDTAHSLFAAAFGCYPARHLFIGPEEPNHRDGPATSWWDAEAVDVPVSLRDRGDRVARGRTAAVPDIGLARERALEDARVELEERRAAAAELIAAGDLHGSRVSPAARDLALDRIGQLLSVHQDLATTVSVTDTDLELTVTLTPAADVTTIVEAADGTVTIHELRVHATNSQTSQTSQTSTGNSSATDARVVG